MRVDMALIFGLIPLFVMEYITIDRFSTPEPAVKKLTTKSSIEIVKASNAPVKIPGIISGTTTFVNP
jgi:hypothetical protein